MKIDQERAKEILSEMNSSPLYRCGALDKWIQEGRSEFDESDFLFVILELIKEVRSLKTEVLELQGIRED